MFQVNLMMQEDPLYIAKYILHLISIICYQMRSILHSLS